MTPHPRPHSFISRVVRTGLSYWHHGTVGMRPLGERTWREWYAAAAGALLAAQDEDGSWPPAGRWAHAGGRVYTTALAVLTLEATYRYP